VDPLVERPPAATIGERERQALWRYARTLGADAHTADDLVQGAIVIVLARPGFDFTVPAAVFGFLRTTCRQLWLRSKRRKLSDREIEEADLVWTARCRDGPGDDYVDALRACVDRLPPRSRSLLAATYAQGEGRTAAGAKIGIGMEGAKSALRRLRTFLHDCIRKRIEAQR
jgi:RNA polymerase sigma-70 factor, ECF subfamily